MKRNGKNSSLFLKRRQVENHNKRLQLDNLRGVEIAVSLSLNYTAIAPPHKLRLKRALNLKRNPCGRSYRKTSGYVSSDEGA